MLIHFISNADVVEFDNSYSYLKSKRIWYNIVVDLPTLEEMSSC